MTVREWISTGRAVGCLRRALRGTARSTTSDEAAEQCEMCAQPIPENHAHVVDLDSRELLCTCRPCSFLFVSEGAAGGRYQAVPERYLSFHEFTLDQSSWDALQIPVGMAFFFRNSRLDRTVAFYPSPAGATESELPIEAWDEILEANPDLGQATPDVEALLVASSNAEVLAPSGTDGAARFECFLVPIDACYELVGHLRKTWRGFDGGEQARARLERFFTDLRARSRSVSGGASASCAAKPAADGCAFNTSTEEPA